MGSGLSLKLTASWSVMLLLLSRMPTCSSLAASRGTMTWALPADMNANRATMCWEARRIKSGSKLEVPGLCHSLYPCTLLLLFHLQIQDHCFGNNIKTFWVIHCLLCCVYNLSSTAQVCSPVMAGRLARFASCKDMLSHSRFQSLILVCFKRFSAQIIIFLESKC